MNLSPDRRSYLSVLAAAFIAAITGCTSNTNSRHRWDKGSPGEATGVGELHIDDGTVYAADWANVFALETADGSEVWRFEDDGFERRDTDTWCYSNDVVGDDIHIYVSSCNGITAFEKQTGEIVWEAGPEGRRRHLTIANERLYSAGRDLVVLNPESRAVEWQRTIFEESPGLVRPTVTDEVVAAAGPEQFEPGLGKGFDPDGRVTLYDLNGTEQFTEEFTALPRQPAVDDDRVYLALETEEEAAGRLVALSREDGTVAWDVDIPLPYRPVVHNDRVYVSTEDIQSDIGNSESELLAYDRNSGEEVLRYTVEATNVTPPVFLEEMMIVSAGERVIGLSYNGEEQWSFEPGGQGRTGQVQYSDDAIYINGGGIRVFDAES